MADDWYVEKFEDNLSFGLKVTKRLFEGKSDFQKVEIFETERFGTTLALDGLYQTSAGDEYFYHEMIAHPAMTTAPNIERVLVIGGGDGGTVREVLRYPQVKFCKMVEIDGLVIEQSKEHLPMIGTAWDDPRLDLVVGDGIAYVKETKDEPYDVIILDGSDPVGPAEGLFNESFFENCKRMLAKGGVFVMQSENPLLFKDVFYETVLLLEKVFGQADPYFGYVPIYGAGYWTWTYCTVDGDHLAIKEDRAEQIEQSCKWYNRDIHRGCFALPNEVKKRLGR
ncbi:MAG: polyamine aminopropyltransferase [Chrysiogenetes bacterium]|nr:polyamine aminopropyltransferase [Chrysiogenetes bacterium]